MKSGECRLQLKAKDNELDLCFTIICCLYIKHSVLSECIKALLRR